MQIGLYGVYWKEPLAYCCLPQQRLCSSWELEVYLAERDDAITDALTEIGTLISCLGYIKLIVGVYTGQGKPAHGEIHSLIRFVVCFSNIRRNKDPRRILLISSGHIKYTYTMEIVFFFLAYY